MSIELLSASVLSLQNMFKSYLMDNGGSLPRMTHTGKRKMRSIDQLHLIIDSDPKLYDKASHKVSGSWTTVVW